jgi:acyl-CoA thioesterase I
MRHLIKTGVPALLGVAVLVSGCGATAADPAPAPAAPSSSPAPSPSPSPSRSPGKDAGVYVAVGASETVGIGADDPGRQAWPTVLHGTALGDWDYLNLGVSGSTVAEAITEQLPRALAAEPDLVTVWLNVNDITHLVPPNVYEQLLGTLVHQLRRDGRTEVLVANTPAVEQLPAYRSCLPSAPAGSVCNLPGVPAPRLVRQVVGEYNAAIDRVAEAEGASVVDLNAESGKRSLVTMTGTDGFHPSTQGHRAVAHAFAASVERVEGQVR